MSGGDAVAARALAMVGTRFRPHGRDPGGLDCVGLAAAATGEPAPSGYALRGGRPDEVAATLDRALARVDAVRAGDVLLFASGPGQLHLAVAVDGGIVHACARARRVVRRRGVAPWPLVGAWRLREG